MCILKAIIITLIAEDNNLYNLYRILGDVGNVHHLLQIILLFNLCLF